MWLGILLAALWMGGCDDAEQLTDAGLDADQDAGQDGADGADTGGCVEPEGISFIVHRGDIRADETWPAGDRKHLVAEDLLVAEGATLTIEPCVWVVIDSDAKIRVDGTLSGEASEDAPITITGGRGIHATSEGKIVLKHATLEDGGLPGAGDAHSNGMLKADGMPGGVLHLENVVVRNSASLGIMLEHEGFFDPQSTQVTVTGSAGRPVMVPPLQAANLPDGSYTGNHIDEILVLVDFYRIDQSTRWRDLGVPYRLDRFTGLTLTVGSADGSQVVFTLDPGVEVRASSGGSILVSNFDNRRGELVAVGTAERPVVFTSGEEQVRPGIWQGIRFSGTPGAETRIEHAIIEYAGEQDWSEHACPNPTFGVPTDTSGGAIRIGSQPSASFLSNSTIRHSASYGIDRDWQGEPVDFLPSNTFEDIAWCHQSYPEPSVGECPDPPPCQQDR